ncbi:MAG: glycosyltransferase [Thermosynechococcaceae cyanobacterium]
MRIAYLINQYPKVSHSFIRREIAALETQGLEIFRFAIRDCAEELVDEEDKTELPKTRFVLQQGYGVLLTRLLQVLLTHPLRFLNALKLAFQVGWRSDRGVLLHFVYLVEACLLLRWFADLEILHAHAHFGTNGTTVLMLCHALGGPTYSFTVHGPEEFDKPIALALGEKLRRAQFVVAISSFTRSQLYRWCPYSEWNKIHVVRCGVDASFLSQDWTSIPDANQLVCVGRLCEQKGQLLLLEAANRLAEEGYDFTLLLVGDGPLRSPIEALIHEFCLAHRVTITGWASNPAVQQHILASRLLVLPSFAEGLPVVLMEALALGRPILSTTVAGIPELVTSQQEGWLIPPGSVEDLTQALKKALETDLSILNTMGQLGQAKVAAQHSTAIETQKLARLFQMHTSEL